MFFHDHTSGTGLGAGRPLRSCGLYPIVLRVHSISMIYHCDVDHDHLAEVGLLGFSTVKFPLEDLFI